MLSWTRAALQGWGEQDVLNRERAAGPGDAHPGGGSSARPSLPRDWLCPPSCAHSLQHSLPPTPVLVLPAGSLAASFFSRTLPGHWACRPDPGRVVQLKFCPPCCCLNTPVDRQLTHFSSNCVVESWDEGVHANPDGQLVSWEWNWLQAREVKVRGESEWRGLMGRF